MFRTKNRKLLLSASLLVVVLLLLLSGCSGDKGGINVELSTYKIDMEETTASAGDVTFHLKNVATDNDHEFVVFKTDLDASQLPLNADGDVDEEQLTSMGEAELKIGESTDLTMNLQPGHYAIVCNMPGHYKEGMYTNFTVQ